MQTTFRFVYLFIFFNSHITELNYKIGFLSDENRCFIFIDSKLKEEKTGKSICFNNGALH